jgi:[CysO sulfur-carrier protein]-S-L-cysteine hydrolase
METWTIPSHSSTNSRRARFRQDDVVTESYWMENIDHSEEHFSFAPKDQFAALKYARSKGLKILANWHSHPASPSRPSQEDLRLANDPNIRYAILSLLDGKIHLNSFKVLNGEVVDKEVVCSVDDEIPWLDDFLGIVRIEEVVISGHFEQN